MKNEISYTEIYFLVKGTHEKEKILVYLITSKVNFCRLLLYKTE